MPHGRIVLVVGSVAGGVGMHVVSLARELTVMGWTVGVVGPASSDDAFGFSRIRGVRFAPLEVPARLGLVDLSSVTRLNKLVVGFRATVVHAHGFRAGLLTLLATGRIRGRRRPQTVVTWHNTIAASGVRGQAETAVAKFLATRADVTLGASADLVDLATRLGADARFSPIAAPVGVVGDDVNAGALRRQIAARLGLSRRATLVLTVGRVAPQKNYDLLLDAAAIWHRENPDIHSIVAGAADPELAERLAARVAAEQLPVHFLGLRSDIALLNQAADIFLLTSSWEARALVVQEAMLAGKPVIATAVGGLPELIGDAGILVEPGEAAAREIADAVLSLTRSRTDRTRLGRLAALKALDFPTEAQAAKRVAGHYRTV